MIYGTYHAPEITDAKKAHAQHQGAASTACVMLCVGIKANPTVATSILRRAVAVKSTREKNSTKRGEHHVKFYSRCLAAVNEEDGGSSMSACASPSKFSISYAAMEGTIRTP